MDLGTSKILAFFGPVVDPWSFYLLSIWQITLKNAGKYGKIFGKYSFFIYDHFSFGMVWRILYLTFRRWWQLKISTFWNLTILKFRIVDSWTVNIWETWEVEYEDREIIKFGSTNLQKLGYESHIDENMKRKFANIFIFERGNPYHPSTYRFPPLHQTRVVP